MAPIPPPGRPVPPSVASAAAVATGASAAAVLAGWLPGGTTAAWSGPLVVAALVLAVAGAAKAVRPAGATAALSALGVPARDGVVRALGAGELALGLAGALVGGRAAAAAVAGCYVAFAAVVAGLRRRPDGPGCGCFGQGHDVAPGRLHLALNLLVATTAGAAAATSAGGVVALAGSHLGPAVLASCVVAAGLLVSAYTVAPPVLAAATPPTASTGSPAPFSLVEDLR